MLRTVEITDAAQITDIYNYYVENSISTFEEQMISVAEMQKRITKVLESGHIWLVAVDQEKNRVIGYAYTARWKERSAYRFTSEISVYLIHDIDRKGIGTELYQALFTHLESIDIHAVIGVITLPNEASVSLHEKFGLKKVAHFEQVGFKFNQWLDVGYWQKVINTN